MEMKYIFMGAVQQQERPRVARYGKTIKLYDPPRSKAYKERLKNEVVKTPYIYTEKPLKAEILIFVEIPKSYSKKKKESAILGELRPAKKPDLSNYVKLVEDAFNGILYKDDSQIIELTAKKFYSENPRLEFSLQEIE
jgi:Holliday junction resolvase RusA-like endonuclease